MNKIFTKSQYKACVRAFIAGKAYNADKANTRHRLLAEKNVDYPSLLYRDSKGNIYKVSQGYRKNRTAYDDITLLDLTYNSNYHLEEPYLELLNTLLYYVHPRVKFANFGGRLTLLRLDANFDSSNSIVVPNGTHKLLDLIRRVIPDFFA